MNYFFGILIIIFSEIIISVANIFDGQLSRKTFVSIRALVTTNGLLLIPVLPLMYILLRPEMPSNEQFFILFIIASLEFSYQIPYYKALREADTSVVVLLFNLEKLFVPILAYFIIGEKLTVIQYIGFVIIIIGSLLITFKRSSLSLNKSMYYMLIVCLIIAIDSVLQKYGLNQIEWKTFYFWILTLSIPFYIFVLLISSSVRKEVQIFFKKPFQKKYIPLFGQNIATWLSGGLTTLGLSILPVSITKLVESFPALIVHLLASKGSKHLQIDSKEIFSFKRICLFILIGIGVFLTFYKI